MNTRDFSTADLPDVDEPKARPVVPPQSAAFGDSMFTAPGAEDTVEAQIARATRASMDRDAEEAAATLQANRSPEVPNADPSGMYQAGNVVAQGGVASDSLALQNMQAVATRGGRMVTVNDPLHNAVRRYDKKATAADAMAESTLGPQEVAKEDYATAIRDHAVDQMKTYNLQAREMEERAAKQQESIAMQQQINRDYEAARDKTVKALSSGTPEDPGAFWASRKGWQKVALIMSAAMKGWLQGQGMSVDPMADIRAGIEMNVEAQRQNRARLGEVLSARERQVAAAHANLEEMQSVFEDQTSRDLAVRDAYEKAAIAEMQKYQAQFNLDMVPVEAKKIMSEMLNINAKTPARTRGADCEALEQAGLARQSERHCAWARWKPLHRVCAGRPQDALIPTQGKQRSAQHGCRGVIDAAKTQYGAESAKSTWMAKLNAKVEASKGEKKPEQQRLEYAQKKDIMDSSAKHLSDAIEEFNKEWAGRDIPGITAVVGSHSFGDRETISPGFASNFRNIRYLYIQAVTGASSPKEMDESMLKSLDDPWGGDADVWGRLLPCRATPPTESPRSPQRLQQPLVEELAGRGQQTPGRQDHPQETLENTQGQPDFDISLDE
ncbi:MAG: hypothetical protein IPK74_39955 [Deltaproteobacteria bacterium]|nr:hypothetical protein [Deltaproteobacteria bacterium]